MFDNKMPLNGQIILLVSTTIIFALSVVTTTTAWVSVVPPFHCTTSPSTSNINIRLHKQQQNGKVVRAKQLSALKEQAFCGGSKEEEEEDDDEQNSLRTQIELLSSMLDARDNDVDDDSNDDVRSIIQSKNNNVPMKQQQEQPEDGNSINTTQVYIIGTGLSDKLYDLPLSTLAILVRADVVLYDALSLSYDEIRRIVPSHCVVESVGKRGDTKGSAIQSDIDSLLLHYATVSTIDGVHPETGRTTTPRIVVRLKGGDPFLFGRSRTEIETLQDNNVPYTVIPNLSSCVAGPHAAGIPLTDPLLQAQSFAVFSGTTASGIGLGSSSSSTSTSSSKRRKKEDGEEKVVSNSVDWASLTVDTLVFLMIGRLDKLEDLCRTLVESGSSGDEESSSSSSSRWNKDTPCAIVRNAGRPTKQETWRATLGTLVDTIRRDIAVGDDPKKVTSLSPAILIVGPTASLDLLSTM